MKLYGEVNVEPGVENSAEDLTFKSSKSSAHHHHITVNDAAGKFQQKKVPNYKASPSILVKFLSNQLLNIKFNFFQARPLLWSGALALTAVASATLGASVALMVPLSPFIAVGNQAQAKKDIWSQGFHYGLSRPVNILVMGIDRVPNVPHDSPQIFTGRSDTMLLLRLDPRDHSVQMLSIPRDTRVDFPGMSIAKINQANADGGAILAAQVVSHTLNNVPIDRYVRVTTGAFRELVDLVGGVDVFVPEPMSYDDNTQNLHIDLAPGWQTLNAEQAEQFARFRNHHNGDIGRVQRQQALLKSLRQRLQTPAMVPRLPQLIRVLSKYIDTNLSLEETLALGAFGLSLHQDNFKMVLLPGRFSTPREFPASYWIMDSIGKERIMRDYFGQELTHTSFAVNPSVNELRIAIQNTTGQPRINRQVIKFLRSKGFYNVYLVNDWSDSQQQTQIIAQQGDVKAAIALKNILGLGKIEASSIGDIKSDITIRVGKDWRL
ncbi:MAG TPA: LCP family protein [Candidatus Sericytochromatia bacterium]